MKKEVLLTIIALSAAILLTTCTKEEDKKVELPTVSTLSVTDITATTAKCGGTIANDGGDEISSKGLVWHTSQNPTLTQNSGKTDEGSGAEGFQSTLKDLTINTQYFVRAYATNSAGTAYGSQEQFKTESLPPGQPCPGMPTVTDNDGNVYNTVLIGNQCWMKENLKTTSYRNGTPIEYPGNDNDAWYNNANGAYAWYDNSTTWKNLYGALYNWMAVNNTNGICPSGWHVPTHDELIQLKDYVVSQGYPDHVPDQIGAGNALKSCRQVDSPLGDTCSTNEHPRWGAFITLHGFDAFGFSALPGGVRARDGSFFDIGASIRLWSATESEVDNLKAWAREISAGFSDINQYPQAKYSGYSVRCIKD
jgi:uncharacterized protein (TIGR02145 family)